MKKKIIIDEKSDIQKCNDNDDRLTTFTLRLVENMKYDWPAWQ